MQIISISTAVTALQLARGWPVSRDLVEHPDYSELRTWTGNFNGGERHHLITGKRKDDLFVAINFNPVYSYRSIAKIPCLSRTPPLSFVGRMFFRLPMATHNDNEIVTARIPERSIPSFSFQFHSGISGRAASGRVFLDTGECHDVAQFQSMEREDWAGVVDLAERLREQDKPKPRIDRTMVDHILHHAVLYTMGIGDATERQRELDRTLLRFEVAKKPGVFDPALRHILDIEINPDQDVNEENLRERLDVIFDCAKSFKTLGLPYLRGDCFFQAMRLICRDDVLSCLSDYRELAEKCKSKAEEIYVKLGDAVMVEKLKSFEFAWRRS